MVLKIRKKPVEVEAMQFTEDNKDQVFSWVSCNKVPVLDEYNNPALKIQTLEGEMIAKLGDFIIKGVEDEYYPCKPDIFHETYDILA